MTITQGAQRHFTITGSLQEGYGNAGRRHALHDVVAFHHAWQQARETIQGCLITAATVSYGVPGDTGITGEEEPGFVLSGDINILYDPTLSDDAACLRVLNLAMWLADHLRQTRLYVAFMGQSFIVENAGTEHKDEQ